MWKKVVVTFAALVATSSLPAQQASHASTCRTGDGSTFDAPCELVVYGGQLGIIDCGSGEPTFQSPRGLFGGTPRYLCRQPLTSDTDVCRDYTPVLTGAAITETGGDRRILTVGVNPTRTAASDIRHYYGACSTASSSLFFHIIAIPLRPGGLLPPSCEYNADVTTTHKNDCFSHVYQDEVGAITCPEPDPTYVPSRDAICSRRLAQASATPPTCSEPTPWSNALPGSSVNYEGTTMTVTPPDSGNPTATYSGFCNSGVQNFFYSLTFNPGVSRPFFPTDFHEIVFCTVFASCSPREPVTRNQYVIINCSAATEETHPPNLLDMEEPMYCTDLVYATRSCSEENRAPFSALGTLIQDPDRRAYVGFRYENLREEQTTVYGYCSAGNAAQAMMFAITLAAARDAEPRIRSTTPTRGGNTTTIRRKRGSVKASADNDGAAAPPPVDSASGTQIHISAILFAITVFVAVWR